MGVGGVGGRGGGCFLDSMELYDTHGVFKFKLLMLASWVPGPTMYHIVPHIEV